MSKVAINPSRASSGPRFVCTFDEKKRSSSRRQRRSRPSAPKPAIAKTRAAEPQKQRTTATKPRRKAKVEPKSTRLIVTIVNDLARNKK